jgi:hypothetical protein
MVSKLVIGHGDAQRQGFGVSIVAGISFPTAFHGVVWRPGGRWIGRGLPALAMLSSRRGSALKRDAHQHTVLERSQS